MTLLESVKSTYADEEIQNAAIVSLVLGALSSAAGAVILHKLEPDRSFAGELAKAAGLGAVTTVASLVWLVYSHEKSKAS